MPHVPPLLPPDPGWRPGPLFVHDERFGVVPGYDPAPLPFEAQAAEPFGPPDLLGDLLAELEALDRRCTEALWARAGEMAGRRLVGRLHQIVATLAPLLEATPAHPRDAVTLRPAPPAGRLHALRDLWPAVQAALRVVRHLITARQGAAHRAAIAAAVAREEANRHQLIHLP